MEEEINPTPFNLKPSTIQLIETNEKREKTKRELKIPGIKLEKGIFFILTDTPDFAPIILKKISQENNFGEKGLASYVHNKHFNSTAFGTLYNAVSSTVSQEERINAVRVLMEFLGLSACFYMRYSHLNQLNQMLMLIGRKILKNKKIILLNLELQFLTAIETLKFMVILEELCDFYNVAFVLGRDVDLDSLITADLLEDEKIENEEKNNEYTNDNIESNNFFVNINNSIYNKAYNTLIIKDYTPSFTKVKSIPTKVSTLDKKIVNAQKEVSFLLGVLKCFKIRPFYLQLLFLLMIFFCVLVVRNFSFFNRSIISQSKNLSNRTDILQKEYHINQLVFSTTIISFTLSFITLCFKNNTQDVNIITKLVYEMLSCLFFSMLLILGYLNHLNFAALLLFINTVLISSRLFTFIITNQLFYFVVFLPTLFYYTLIGSFDLDSTANKIALFLPHIAIIKYVHAVLYKNISLIDRDFLNLLSFANLMNYQMGIFYFALYFAIILLTITIMNGRRKN